jgi:gliding motility-associated-like protein
MLPAFGQHFVPNEGQWEEPFSYRWMNNQGAVFIEKKGISIHLADFSAYQYHHDNRKKDSEPFDMNLIRHHAVKMRFIDGQKGNWVPEDKSESYHNYILGKDPERWRSNVPLYGSVRQEEIYNGINIKYYTDGNSIKYDLEVSPNGNYEEVQMEYSGLDSMFLEEGFLIMRTSLGEIIEQKPIAWQINGTEKKYVKCDFVLTGSTVSFKVTKHNKRLPLIIDPQYIFSTYTGSLADNFGFTACFDSTSNMYSGGIAFNIGYPVTTGAFQDTFAGGFVDMAITKFNSSGTQLIYSTYIGGSQGPDQPHSMVASNNDGLVIMGVSGSSDYPVTANALDTSFNGGPSVNIGGTPFSNGADIVVTHLNSTGGALIGSTFIGGTDTDGANKNLTVNYGDNSRGEVIVDSSFIHVATSTFSNDFMGTNWGFFTKQNAAIFSLNNDCSQSPFKRVLMGSDDDAALGVRAMRDSGSYYLIVVGGTKSMNLPTTNGSYQQQFGGGSTDGFILKYDWSLDQIKALTYNGTNAYDQNFFIDIDRDNAIYVFGQTLGQYPVTPATWAIANSSQFLHKLSSDLGTSLVSTVFGNNQRNTINISPTAFMVDECKNLYLSGWGGNVGFQQGSTIGLPTTPDAQDSTTNGNDFYFLVLDGSWKSLEYASFFGDASAEHVDGGTSRFSKDGTIYQAICAGCGNQSFPTFPANVYSSVNGSNNCNLGSTKIEFSYQGPNVDVIIPNDTNCVPWQLDYINNSTNVDLMFWDYGDGTVDTGFTPSKLYTDTGTFYISIIGVDTLCQIWDTTRLKIRLENNIVNPGFTISPYDTCQTPFTISLINTTIGATSFLWEFGDGATSTLTNPTHIYSFQGTFEIKLISFDNICNSSDTVVKEVTFKNPPDQTDFLINQDACNPAIDIELTQLGSGFQYHEWDMGNGDTLQGGRVTYNYQNPGIYTVTLLSYDTVCNILKTQQKQVTIIATVDINEIMPNVFTPNNDGDNDLLSLVDSERLNGYTSFAIEIYNRWGDIVFKSSDNNFSWNGTFEKRVLSEGVYFWLIYAEDACQGNSEAKGVVHIIK